MDDITVIPIIRLGNTLNDSVITEAHTMTSNVRYVFKDTKRLQGEPEPLELSTLVTRHGTSLLGYLPLIETLKRFKVNFLGNPSGESYYPISNIKAVYDINGVLYVETLQDRMTFNYGREVFFFDGDAIKKITTEDIVHLWRMDSGLSKTVKNLKIAVGGNV